MDGVSNAVLIVGEGVVVGEFVEFGDGVAHCDAAGGIFDHGDVVDFIADGCDLVEGDIVLSGEPLEAGPFVDTFGEDFEDVDVFDVVLFDGHEVVGVEVAFEL